MRVDRRGGAASDPGRSVLRHATDQTRIRPTRGTPTATQARPQNSTRVPEPRHPDRTSRPAVDGSVARVRRRAGARCNARRDGLPRRFRSLALRACGAGRLALEQIPQQGFNGLGRTPRSVHADVGAAPEVIHRFRCTNLTPSCAQTPAVNRWWHAERGATGGQARGVQRPVQQGQHPRAQPRPPGRPDRLQVLDQPSSAPDSRFRRADRGHQGRPRQHHIGGQQRSAARPPSSTSRRP